MPPVFLFDTVHAAHLLCCVLQLLQLEQDVVRGLVLRQPSLLARASEGLQSKVKEYADIFEDEVGLVSRLLGWGFGRASGAFGRASGVSRGRAPPAVAARLAWRPSPPSVWRVAGQAS